MYSSPYNILKRESLCPATDINLLPGHSLLGLFFDLFDNVECSFFRNILGYRWLSSLRLFGLRLGFFFCCLFRFGGSTFFYFSCGFLLASCFFCPVSPSFDLHQAKLGQAVIVIPPIAPRATTSHGGRFHITSKRKATTPNPKSAGSKIALVHTGE